MPQDGSGNYTIPLGTYGIPDETIESAAYNNFLNDLRDNDLNKPRPIHRGGTGAINADAALVNLSAEKAAQLVTPSFDAHVWYPGSFRSTNAPGQAAPVDGHAFSGICYINEPLVNPPTNANVVVSARDLDDTVVPSRVYVREKKANVWGAWTVIDATTLPFPPGGGITGDTIVEAIQELALEKADITYVDAQDATLKTYVDTQDAGLQTNINAKADITYVNSITTLSYDGLAYLGMQTNGSFLVNQDRNPGVPNTLPGACHITDGWKAFHAPFSRSQIDIATVRGMNQYTHLPYNTPAALAAGDTFYIYTGIEGYRANRLGWGSAGLNSLKMPMTISFLSANQRVGTYCVAIQNAAHDQSYVATYVQAVAGTEQFNAITIPPCLSSTWLKDSGVGMYIYFSIGIGSTYQTSTPNTWVTGNKLSVVGAVNAYQDITDRIRLTGVMINMGNVAPTVDRVPFLVRPYDQEFSLCQRYYQAMVGTVNATLMSGTVYTTNTAIFSHRFPTQMRVPPTFGALAPSNFSATASGTGYAGTAITAPNLNPEGARIDLTTTGGMTVGHGALLSTSSFGIPDIWFDAGFV